MISLKTECEVCPEIRGSWSQLKHTYLQQHTCVLHSKVLMRRQKDHRNTPLTFQFLNVDSQWFPMEASSKCSLAISPPVSLPHYHRQSINFNDWVTYKSGNRHKCNSTLLKMGSYSSYKSSAVQIHLASSQGFPLHMHMLTYVLSLLHSHCWLLPFLYSLRQQYQNTHNIRNFITTFLAVLYAVTQHN